MGERKSRLNSFRLKHPNCCLCGGENPTETIEHSPPKVMFWSKHRLKGMEVPACRRCNNGLSSEDQLAAFFALSQSQRGNNLSNEESNYLDKIITGVTNNIPEMKQMIKLGGNFGIQSNKVIFDHTLLFGKYLNKWAAKQSIAHWYELTEGRILSSDGLIAVRWQTNYELAINQEFTDLVSKLGERAELFMGEWRPSDQFFLRYSINLEEGIGAIFAAYHNCGFIAFLVEDRELLSGLKIKILGTHGSAYAPDKKQGLVQIDRFHPS